VTPADVIAYVAGLRAAHADGYEQGSQARRMRIRVAVESVRVLRDAPDRCDWAIAGCESLPASRSAGIARNETKRNK
jgi:hypothetical protein